MSKVKQFMLPHTGDDIFDIEMPIGAEILSARLAGAKVAIHALCPSGKSTKSVRRFVLVNNGQDFDASVRKFIATLSDSGFFLTCHLFEVL